MAAQRPRLTAERLLSWETLVLAYRAARRGKRHRPGVDAWFADWELRLLSLRERLRAGYVFGPYHCFQVRDPRPREVAAAPFEDRVVHHAIVALLQPACEPGMIATSFACRTGLGGAAMLQALRARCRSGAAVYFAKCDVRRYFPSIRHDVLHDRLRRYCGDRFAEELLGSLLGSYVSPSQEPGARGIPIGNLTSQLFANLYLSDVDHYMLRTAGAAGYMRYVDDMLWFGPDKDRLWAQIGLLQARLSALGLALHPRKIRVGRVVDGVDFAGVVASPLWLRLRGETKRRGLRHLAALRRGYRRGQVKEARYLQRMRSLVGLGQGVGATAWLRKRGLLYE